MLTGQDSDDGFPGGLLQAPTVAALLWKRAERTPDAGFLVDERGVSVSFADARDRVERVAAALASRGIGPGDRVAWQLPTRLSTVLVLLALRRLGALQAPIIAQYRQRELDAAVTQIGARFLLIPGTWKGVDYREMAAAVPAPLTTIEVGIEAPEEADTSRLHPLPDDAEQPSWVFFTSGSSGSPKGVLHCDRSLMSAGRGMTVRGRVGERREDTTCIPFPIAHVGGPLHIVSLLTSGTSSLLFEAFRLPESLPLLQENRVSMIGGGPVFYQSMLTEQRRHPETPVLPSLRQMSGGGAPCPPNLFDEVRDELGARLLHCYGMTECPMICIASPSDSDDQLRETEGRPAPGMQLRIWDEGPVPVGVDGEVQLRGTNVCLGYTTDDANDAAFTEDGWFRTGDRAHLREDGYVEVTGRVKEIIIRKGEKIAPQELEQILSGHPSVEAVAVVGLPDDARGELVCVVAVPRQAGSTVVLTELADCLRQAGVMEQKIPERLEIVDELPRRGLGKVDKAVLRRTYSQQAAGLDSVTQARSGNGDRKGVTT